MFFKTDDSEERKGFMAEYRSADPATVTSRTTKYHGFSREPLINND